MKLVLDADEIRVLIREALDARGKHLASKLVVFIDCDFSINDEANINAVVEVDEKVVERMFEKVEKKASK